MPTENPTDTIYQAHYRFNRIRYLNHLARAAPIEDYRQVIAAALRHPADWKRPAGRLRTTWLRTVDEDVQPQNFGVHTAWRKAKGRLAPSHQYGHALTRVYQEEEVYKKLM